MALSRQMIEALAREEGQRSWANVERQLKYAIELVEGRDRELLEDDTNECAVAHRIAVYLDDRFPGWKVDCEFNRQGSVGARDTKRTLPSLPMLPPTRRSLKASVRPDIIVHKRREKDNLLVIEVKPADSDKIPRDRVKLRQFLVDPDLNYTHAVWLIYRIGENAGFEPIEVMKREAEGTSMTPED